jgi:hypothetical protein
MPIVSAMDRQSLIEITLAFMGAAGLITALLVFLKWDRSRSRLLLDKWAEQRGFQVLACESRAVFRGPIEWWLTSRGVGIYFVKMRDTEGRERSAWVRFGNRFEFFRNEVEVKWNES